MLRKAILVAGSAGLMDLLGRSFLARDGFVLLPAALGGDVLCQLEKEDPALAILDLDLPGLLESCRRIRGDRLLQNTPRILVASAVPEPWWPDGREEILPKPVDRDRLLSAVCRFLGIEQRAAPRPKMCLSARVGSRLEKLDHGQVRNLSLGGAFVETGSLLPVGTPVIMEIIWSESSPGLQCRGRVAWVNHPEWVKKPTLPIGMGVEFLDLDEGERKTLQSLLSGRTA